MTPEELHTSILELLPPDWVSNISVKSEESGGPLFINLLNLYVVQIELDGFSKISVKLGDLYFIRDGGRERDINTMPFTIVYTDKISRLNKSLVPPMIDKIRDRVLDKLEPTTLSKFIASKRFISRFIDLYNPWRVTILRYDYLIASIHFIDDSREIHYVDFQIKLDKYHEEILECLLVKKVYNKENSETTSTINIDLTDKLPNVDLMLGYSSAQLLLHT